MSVKPEIQITADGSHTLFVPELNEHYHSVNGAVQESSHVFINAGLKHCTKDRIHIFEVGFGTGLNAFLTLLDAQSNNKTIHYTTIEAYPLDKSIVEKLNYPQLFSQKDRLIYQQLHDAEWNVEVEITPHFFLQKVKVSLLDFDFSLYKAPFDLIYFDAFAPDKQPEMWTQEIFNHLFEITTNNGILVTYCAKGVVRRMMQAAGYTVERLPGPPGKREMLRA
ncbi:MAG: tRNA (5-methylaminomethyl-2-thiouridine)(34)-methyltransferase MnmD, partial [Tannerella sp.]|nr:tRNA (5-methylaminomethyl-2-thiouridine)(34)-methyltransferase MnmD [Tannerella sp.]